MSKERPMLFSSPMVLALLADTKTMTRRMNTLAKSGDHIWVKETHIPKASGVIYRADLSDFDAAGISGMYGGWKPSIFMPRWASRITLEVVAVRVERLQDIQERDAIAEGVTVTVRKNGAIAAFRELWDSINGKKAPWSSNPHVFAITFKRIKP